jgi:hypothetical protein
MSRSRPQPPDGRVDLVRGDELAARSAVTALATPRAIALGLLAAALASARLITRRWQVRILAQPLGQLRHPLRKHCELLE